MRCSGVRVSVSFFFFYVLSSHHPFPCRTRMRTSLFNGACYVLFIDVFSLSLLLMDLFSKKKKKNR